MRTKRMRKLYDPYMLSARVERGQFEQFSEILRHQPYLTLQDFVGYALKLFNDGYIAIEGKDFVLTERARNDVE